MREIKFRGKREDNGEWAYGSLINNMFKTPSIIDTNLFENYDSWEDIDLLAVDVDQETVGQYTGLKDRSGKEIYEGDIVRYLDGADCSSESGYDFDEFMNVGVIAWDKQSARYVVSNRNLVDLETFFEEIGESEVIGNIYENPDLIGGTGA